MRVSITGANGYIGSSLARYLQQSCIDVVSVCRSSGTFNDLPGLRIADFLDIDSLSQAFDGSDVVVHAAGLAHDPSLLRLPLSDSYPSYCDANILASSKVVQAAIKSGVKRVILISSVSVYGLSSKPGYPFTKHSLISPASAYAVSKHVSEIVVSNLCTVAGIDFVILRIPLVYSSGCPGNLSRLLSLFASVPVNIFEAFVAERSFLSLKLLLLVLRLCLDSDSVSNSLYNLSDVHTVSVASLAFDFYSSKDYVPFKLPYKASYLFYRAFAWLSSFNSDIRKLTTPFCIDSSDLFADLGLSSDSEEFGFNRDRSSF